MNVMDLFYQVHELWGMTNKEMEEFSPEAKHKISNLVSLIAGLMMGQAVTPELIQSLKPVEKEDITKKWYYEWEIKSEYNANNRRKVSVKIPNAAGVKSVYFRSIKDKRTEWLVDVVDSLLSELSRRDRT